MLMRSICTVMLAAGAICAVTALAYAEETIIEKRTYETETRSVEVVPVPEVKERVVEERIVKERPMVEKRTDTVVTHEHDDDENDD